MVLHSGWIPEAPRLEKQLNQNMQEKCIWKTHFDKRLDPTKLVIQKCYFFIIELLSF
jgi:hypothetical protein